MSFKKAFVNSDMKYYFPKAILFKDIQIYLEYSVKVMVDKNGEMV